MSGEIVLGLASPALVARTQDLTTRALQAWSGRWAQDVSVDAAVAEPGPLAGVGADGSWFVERATGAARPIAALWQPAALEAHLVRRLYGAPASALAADSLAMRSVRHLAQDLRLALAQAWRVKQWLAGEGDGAVDASSRWHAPLDVRVTVAGATLVARVPALRLRPAPVATRANAITRAQTVSAFAAQPVRATAVVGRADLSVAELANVRCGDVLLLDASISQPLQIEIDGVPSGLRADVGVVGAQRAVQFVAPPRP